MPVIAIAPCGKLPDYEESVRRAGGDVRVSFGPLTRRPTSSRRCRGCFSPAGRRPAGDLRRDRASDIRPAEPGRDEYEIELVRLALAADLPVFAICRGVQVLNVARAARSSRTSSDEVGTTVNHASSCRSMRSRTTSGLNRDRCSNA
jgi:hypothetical protein